MYVHKKETNLSFEKAVDKVKEELKKEGFGVLSEIRVDKLFKEKLGLDMEEYVILGVCNPKFSSQLIGIDYDSGAFLPCNILVYIKGGKTYVSAMLPTKAMEVAENEKLLKVAEQVEEIVKRVVDRV
ncbi:hypothetical protein PAP_08825 [Palaeococcus pacificus DY20341]|uniref:DUF302 domain-containing protein n=1 Tax=Palaeococcus pacificus DY20341 TaxID=1343739 RepID=A0A075LTW0_9EURY|nr:DUF302 domain-containing protein [Palaeococcus pacificus]AIF70145.1 hypothetical protein PAP_08825 [Palaeococcus pacificus DY20341]